MWDGRKGGYSIDDHVIRINQRGQAAPGRVELEGPKLPINPAALSRHQEERNTLQVEFRPDFTRKRALPVPPSMARSGTGNAPLGVNMLPIPGSDDSIYQDLMADHDICQAEFIRT